MFRFKRELEDSVECNRKFANSVDFNILYLRQIVIALSFCYLIFRLSPHNSVVTRGKVANADLQRLS